LGAARDIRAEVGAALADCLRAAAVDRGRVSKATGGDHERAAAGDDGVAGGAARGDRFDAAVDYRRDGDAAIGERATSEDGRALAVPPRLTISVPLVVALAAMVPKLQGNYLPDLHADEKSIAVRSRNFR
jgi:hypothetical protein